MLWGTCLIMLGGIGAIVLAILAGQAIADSDTEILFGAEDISGFYIYRMDMAHQLLHRITNDTVGEYHPTWSADGEQIAYGTMGSIIVRNINNDSPRNRQIISNSGYNPEWSPNGQYLVYFTRHYGQPELMLADLKTGKIRRLTNNQHNDNAPTWSPDSRFIAFMSDKNQKEYDIDTIDIQTGDIRPLIATPANEINPSWSPDGRYILYVGWDQESGIYLWDVAQSRSIFLRAGVAFLERQKINWSFDSRFIIYADAVDDHRNGLFQLEIAPCVQDPKTCQPQLLTSSPVYIYQNASWRPHTS